MWFSFSILINAKHCSLSTQRQSYCFLITIMACIFHRGNTFHKPCQALDFPIWYALFWRVRSTLHKQFGHEFRLPDDFESVSILEVLYYRSIRVICFLLKFSSWDELMIQKSNIGFVSCFSFWLFLLIRCLKLKYTSNIFYFPRNPASKYDESIIDEKRHMYKKINNFLKPFLRIKMPSLVSDRNLIRLNLTFDIKNIESKLANRCLYPMFFVVFPFAKIQL